MGRRGHTALWTTREYELSGELHNWDDLRVELTRQGDTTAPESELRRVLVSLVEMELPYPETFIFPYLNPATTTHHLEATQFSARLECRKAMWYLSVVLTAKQRRGLV
jgi:hypothetical protein